MFDFRISIKTVLVGPVVAGCVTAQLLTVANCGAIFDVNCSGLKALRETIKYIYVYVHLKDCLRKDKSPCLINANVKSGEKNGFATN